MSHNVKFNPIKKIVYPPKIDFSKTIINKHQPNMSKFPALNKEQQSKHLIQLIQGFKPKLDIHG